MMTNDWQRFLIAMEKPFDYLHFSEGCATQSVEPLDANEYAQKMGMIFTAKVMFPDLEERQAYLKFLEYANDQRERAEAAKSGFFSPAEMNAVDGRKSTCCSDQQPPDKSLASSAKSAGLALAKWLAAGMQNLSRSERDTRMAICGECLKPGEARCPDCGCFVAVKSWMATEHCPREKW